MAENGREEIDQNGLGPVLTLRAHFVRPKRCRVLTRTIHGPRPRRARVALRSKSAILPICVELESSSSSEHLVAASEATVSN